MGKSLYKIEDSLLASFPSLSYTNTPASSQNNPHALLNTPSDPTTHEEQSPSEDSPAQYTPSFATQHFSFPYSFESSPPSAVERPLDALHVVDIRNPLLRLDRFTLAPRVKAIDDIDAEVVD
ncbi:hypothetical protein GYMLUDRAFT_561889 [Collybiopsis luxurians FD-317 M1]|uniref:Uncharacterized protein n=1 Tax=Collybiopsis luxurians FD-317 M1 TaxID=944289 RepID=A0A0D0CZM6_9AGAR|nr:hypothetical protein GYMLUDRAFT_561889 [Collybiopsis luxurians FD-317 M1]